jgi:excisionase family DNA binding protein
MLSKTYQPRSKTMTDTMAREWRTVSEAASMLGISTRTVQRMIKSGQLESMMDEAGRRLVDVSDTVTPGDSVSETLAIVGQQQEKAMQMANSMIAAASRRAEQVDEEVKRARRMTSRTMMVVGVLLVLGIAAAWHMASSLAEKDGMITAAHGQATDLKGRMEEVRSQQKEIQDGQKANLAALATQLQDRTAEATRTGTQRDLAVDKLTKLESEKATLDNDLASSKFENTRLKSQISDLERRMTQLRSDLGSAGTQTAAGDNE